MKQLNCGNDWLHLAPLAGRGRIALAIRVRGSVRKDGGNRLKNAGQIARNVVIPEPQDTVIAIRKPPVTNEVALAIGMLPAVHLDDETTFTAYEIYSVRTDRLLPDEFVTAQPARSKAVPEQPFRVRRDVSQPLGAFGLGLIGTAHAEIPPHPPCSGRGFASTYARRPLPARGERRQYHGSI
jgi:hypothetical protein